MYRYTDGQIDSGVYRVAPQLKIYVRTVVPINVVGTTVHINSLKIGKIKTLSKFFSPQGNEQKKCSLGRYGHLLRMLRLEWAYCIKYSM